MSTDREEYARSLGIKVDGRWSEERLEQEIAKAEDAMTAPPPPPAPKAPETIPVRVLRDFWTAEIGPDGDNVRVRANTIIDVPPMQAIEMIEAGAVERVR